MLQPELATSIRDRKVAALRAGRARRRRRVGQPGLHAALAAGGARRPPPGRPARRRAPGQEDRRWTLTVREHRRAARGDRGGAARPRLRPAARPRPRSRQRRGPGRERGREAARAGAARDRQGDQRPRTDHRRRLTRCGEHGPAGPRSGDVVEPVDQRGAGGRRSGGRSAGAARGEVGNVVVGDLGLARRDRLDRPRW